MTGPPTTRRRWFAGFVTAAVVLVIAGSPEIRAQSEWIGEVPPVGQYSPDEQVFLKADLDEAVAGTLRDMQAEIRQALEDAGVEVTWADVRPPAYRFAVGDANKVDRALQIVMVAVPDADFEIAGAEIRIRLADSLLARMRSDVVLKSANHLRHHARHVLTGPVADVDGQDPEIKVYVHEDNCIRLDVVGRAERHHTEPLKPYMELVPLYPTLDADSDHLPQGFYSLRIERDSKAAMPADERKATRPADIRMPEFRPEEPPLEALKHWTSRSPVEPHGRSEPQDRWKNIVGGRPIVTNGHFVDAEIERRPSGHAVLLRLDVVGEARAARLLPDFQGREFGLVVDNTVIGRFKTVTKSDLGIRLLPDVLPVEAEALVGWLNDTVIAADLESAEACPATNKSR